MFNVDLRPGWNIEGPFIRIHLEQIDWVRVSIKILTPRSKFHEWKSEIENLEKGWIIEGGRSHLAYLAVSSI